MPTPKKKKVSLFDSIFALADPSPRPDYLIRNTLLADIKNAVFAVVSINLEEHIDFYIKAEMEEKIGAVEEALSFYDRHIKLTRGKK